jgi:type I restriction-modification system DNA methylase subunit
VTKNLYGVDINAESVEITRLAPWLKTARTNHRLQNLEATIQVGDSLISDTKYTERPFDWSAAFPDVFARGGFDVVIGNPPYVRSEHLSAFKPWLRNNFSVFDAGADLYCYFYERGLKILRDGGRLGFISSCGFFKTAFGTRLREYLKTETVVECGIDFGDTRIFEDVTTYPTVLTLRKQKPPKNYEISFLNYSGDGSDDLGSAFVDQLFSFPSERLNRSRWHFEVKDLWKLRNSLEKKAARRLGEISSPVSGIKTGLTKAFVVSVPLEAV